MWRRNSLYGLHSWDADAGYGLVVDKHRKETFFLPPLPLVIYTFSDGAFTRDDVARLLNAHSVPADSPAYRATDATIEKLVERRLLLPVAESQASDMAEPADAAKSPTPNLHSLYLYVTYRCNLRCYHCYQRGQYAEANGFGKSDEIKLPTLIQAIDQAVPLGLKSVKITGGEAFVRRDMEDLIQELSDRNLHVSIETNGTMISAARAILLAKCNVSVSVSLDAPTAAHHNDLRGARRAFQKTLNGIRNLTAAGVAVKVITAVSKRNLSVLEETIQLASELGAAELKVNPVNTLGMAATTGIDADVMSAIEVRDLYRKIRAEKLEDRYGIRLFMEGPPSLFTLAEIANGCCGSCPFLNILGILSTGQVSFCGIGYSEPALRLGKFPETSIPEIWTSHATLRAAREAIPGAIKGVCAECVFLSRCGGSCRALAYQGGGSFDSPHPWCQELYDNGVFPKQYLWQHEQEHADRVPESV